MERQSPKTNESHLTYSLPRSRFLEALRDIQKTAARETILPSEKTSLGSAS